MIPTLEKIIRGRSGQILLPLMVSAESTCVYWPDCPRRGLVQAPEIPLSLRWDSRPGCLLLPPPLRHDRSPIPESWTFSDAADRRRQFHQWTQRQQVDRSSRIALRLLPNDSPTLRSKLSTLPTGLSGQGKKFPELSTILKRLPSRRSPCRRSDFRRSVRGTGRVSYLLWRRS